MRNVKKMVRDNYARVAKGTQGCCGGGATSCCGGDQSASERVGYKAGDLAAIPGGADLGLGCGNPVALASLKKGETVLDLGSGGGIDCFLAAKKVGPKGRVIGVDMTPEMLDRARGNAAEGGYPNVEFRLGEIEHLPVADATVDIIISNCVINLSEDKPQVFREAFRVLKPGGRLMVSDIVLLGELPPAVMKSVAAYVGCIAGASQKEEYLEAICQAGFSQVEVAGEDEFGREWLENDPDARAMAEKSKISAAQARRLAERVVSVKVSAVKPA
jgi:SAM-dependent methyltransferase